MTEPTDTKPQLAHTDSMETEALRAQTWEALERDLHEDSGALGRLRAQRTPVRAALAALIALTPAALTALLHPERLRAEHALLALLVLASGFAVLAPLGRTRSRLLRGGLALLALLAPLASAVAHGSAELAEAHAVQANAARCFGYGALCTAPAFVLVLLLSRTPLRSALELALLAGVSGIAASLLLDVHCASRHLLHLVLGHASIGAGAAATYALCARALRR